MNLNSSSSSCGSGRPRVATRKCPATNKLASSRAGQSKNSSGGRRESHPMTKVILISSVLLLASTLAINYSEAQSSIPSKQFSTSNSTSSTTTQATTTLVGTTSTGASPTQPASSAVASEKGSTRDEQDILHSGTSQSVRFAEPPQEQPQRQQQQPAAAASAKSLPSSLSAGSNRWTHFGARLKPLTGAHHHNQQQQLGHQDHHQAANSKSLAYSEPRQLRPLSSNSADGQGEAAADDDDDDQDSEALLYKMMQQQSFLMSPMWQQAEPAPAQQAQGRQASQQQLQVAVAGNGNGLGAANSKKVIKLLKSYSHIHQVDDSDDQIRGTYTRLPARQAHRRQPQLVNPRHPTAQHIFVSSRPLSRASSSQAVDRSRSRYNPPPANQYLAANQDSGANDAENYSPSPEASQDSQGNQQDDGSGGGGPGGAEEEEFECPNNGIFADEPSGCQAYHVCQSGAQVQQRFQCPLGTLFNNIILTCDFAHNVQCGSKGKNAPATGKQEAQEPHDSIYQPAQQQQVPRSSNLYNQPSHVQTTSRPRQQQARWSPVNQGHQQQQPRQLQVGQSQYNKHSQVQPNQVQALNSYPNSRPIVSTAPSPSDNSDSDSDSDDQVEPLIAATLPPRPAQQQAHYQQQQPQYSQNSQRQLPYNPPPPPPRQYQSAHRSQQQPQSDYSKSVGNYDNDGASVVTPVFVDQDSANKEQANNFNLVVNHVAPASSIQKQPANSNHQQTNNRPTYQSQNVNLKQQQHINQIKPNKPLPSKPAKSHQQKQQSSYSTVATQPKPVHVDANQPRGVLVDLTNDNKAGQSVSSESLNDGLLLIVRHNAVPVKLSGNQLDYSQQESRTRPGKQTSAGQAYAVDPALVRPNSPIDAELFPNVQRFVSAAHNEHQSYGNQVSAATTLPSIASPQQTIKQHQQPPRQAAYADASMMTRVSPPLPPLEPPKPNPSQPIESHPSNDLHLVASSTPSILQQQQQTAETALVTSKQQAKQSKRAAKRLKASQMPLQAEQTTKKEVVISKRQKPQKQAPTVIESRTSVVVHQHQVEGNKKPSADNRQQAAAV